MDDSQKTNLEIFNLQCRRESLKESRKIVKLVGGQDSGCSKTMSVES